MSGGLAEEIRQTRPFKCLEEELYLNLERTAFVLRHPVATLLKGHGVSLTQYNVLRILRGAGNGGRTCTEIAERLVTRDSDITRLLDRLEAQGLVERQRNERDRRIVRARITRKGLELLEALDEPLVGLLVELFGHMTRAELNELVELLERARVPLVARAREPETNPTEEVEP